MTQRTVENKPSQTALFVALRRTLANKEYGPQKFGPDYLAEIFLPPHFRFFLKFARVRENTKQKLADAMPGMTEYVIARTRFFDSQFVEALQDRIPQIVLLGAGYDARPYRFARLIQGTRIFELDAAPTQERKLKCLKAAHIDIPDYLHYVPIDFMKEALPDVLERAGYQHQQKTLYIWEGVSMYLDWDSVRKTLDFVSCAHTASVIVFDYTIPLAGENTPEVYGASELSQSMKEHHADEGLEFSIQDEQIEAFLVGLNLRMIEHLDNQLIEQKYLTDETGALIGRVAGNFRIVRASPGN